jgi:hypothetical protein
MTRRRRGLGANVGDLFEPEEKALEQAADPLPAPPPPPAPPPGAPIAPKATAAASAPVVAIVPPLAELSLPMREVLDFPLRFIAQLPLPTTLVCEVVASGRLKLLGTLVVLTTAKEAYVAARAKRLPTFIGREMGWLALGVEHDRIGPSDFARWLERKVAESEWRIDGQVALGELGSTETLAPKNWPTGRVLHELGLRLVAVGTGSETPVFGAHEHTSGELEPAPAEALASSAGGAE